MSGDLASMAAQFTDGVRPRDTGSSVGNMMVNSTGMPMNSNDPNTSAMVFGSTGEGAGNSYTQASQNLARVAMETAKAALAVEFASLVGRAARGEYLDEVSRGGAEARMDQIAEQTGYGRGYRGEIK